MINFRFTNRLHYLNSSIEVVQRLPAGADDWFLAGGAPMPDVVYNVREGGSLPGSKINVVNPGTNDAAPGAAPTWSGVTGWGFNGVDRYLTTGYVVADAAHAILVRFSGGATTAANGFLIGSNSPIGGGGAGVGHFVRNTNNANGQRRCRNGSAIADTGGAIASGVYGYAEDTVYFNGSSEGTITGLSGTNGVALYIGAQNNNGVAQSFGLSNILYLAIWADITDHAVWFPAVSAAVASL